MKFKIKQSYYRLFSVLLSVVMIVLSVPISSFAEPYSDRDVAETSQTIPSTNLGEIESEEITLPIDTAEMTAVTDDIITDGVYAFRNVANPNMWLDTRYDSPLPDNYMQQCAYGGSPAATANFFKGGLFKIKCMSTANPHYVIRLMTNNELIFRSNTSTGYIHTLKVSPVDTSVPSASRYLLQKTDSGYIIKLVGSPYCISAPNSNASGASGADASKLTYLSPTEAQTDTRAQWQLYKYEGPSNHTVTIHSGPSEMIVGEISSFYAYTSSTEVGVNGPIVYSLYNTDGSTPARATIHSGTGEIRATATGQIRINFTCSGTSASTYRVFTIASNAVGRFFFENVEFPNKYVQINNNNSMLDSGEIIELHSFLGYDYQKWSVNYIANGYYKIVSKYSGLELTAPTGSGNSVVTQTTPSDEYTHQWKFIKQANGTYKISPRSNLNYYLAAGDLSSTADQDLEIRRDQSDGRDEWCLNETNDSYSLNIVHYYDLGYVDRFGNASSGIQDYQSICSAVLSELFNVNVSYSVTSLVSSADLCTGSSNTTISCIHADQNTISHKTQTSLRNDIGAGDSITTKVIWTGHVLEDNQNSTADPNTHTVLMTIYAVTDSSKNYQNYPAATIREQRIYTLLHEISHQLGAIDHYCYGTTTSNCNHPDEECWICDKKLTNKPDCIMFDRMSDLETRVSNGNFADIYCYYCTNNAYSKGIAKHLNDHH